MKKPQKMRLGIIGTVGVPARYGGFETLVHQFISHIENQYEITVYCSSKAYKKEDRVSSWKGAKTKYIPLKANGLQSIFYDIVCMLHALIFCDVLLVLGVSGCIILPIIKVVSRKKVLVNIDGLEWRRPKWNWLAKRFLKFSEQVACKFADEIITDNRILQEYVNIRYNVKSRLIEYGSDHTQRIRKTTVDYRDFPFLVQEYAIKVARIEPENNIHLVLKAFSQMPEHTLVLIGNWDNSQYGRKLKAEYSIYRNIYLFDPIYDDEKLNLLRSNASLYIHGHSAGGTNPSLVEAMFLGLPIFSIDVIYNRITTNNQAIYFDSVTDLIQMIRAKEAYDLNTVRYNLQQIAFSKYTWERIIHLYCLAIEGKEEDITIRPRLKTVIPRARPMPA